MLEKIIEKVGDISSKKFNIPKELLRATTLTSSVIATAILPACDNTQSYPSGQETYQKNNTETQIIDLGNGNIVEIIEDNGKISVRSIVNKKSVENPLETSHTQASRHFNQILEKYTKDMNSYYKIKPGSLKISDTDGENYSIGYEVELVPVNANNNHIRYLQTADSVWSSNTYNKAETSMKFHADERTQKIQNYFKNEFVNKESGTTEKNTLCENAGFRTQVQTLPLEHKGEDNGNTIAFGGNLIAGVCKNK